jgi:hypothetical protein
MRNDQHCFICPLAQNYYGYFHPMPRLTTDTEKQYLNCETEAEIPCENTLVNEARTPRDVEKVVRKIEKDARNELKELERIGINSALSNYLITSMVSYMDRNYNRYKGSFDQKIQAAEKDIKRDLYWIFDIFRVMSASPATVSRLIETVVRTSLKHLRPTHITPPVQPPPPAHMPR